MKEKRTARITINITPEDKEIIRRHAKTTNQSISSWVVTRIELFLKISEKIKKELEDEIEENEISESK